MAKYVNSSVDIRITDILMNKIVSFWEKSVIKKKYKPRKFFLPPPPPPPNPKVVPTALYYSTIRQFSN